MIIVCIDFIYHSKFITVTVISCDQELIFVKMSLSREQSFSTGVMDLSLPKERATHARHGKLSSKLSLLYSIKCFSIFL